jgi:hypothetical protein
MLSSGYFKMFANILEASHVAVWMSGGQDFNTTTHIHIPYTGSPQIQHITILTTDFHPIGKIHTISKDLTASPFHPLGFSTSEV